MGYPIKQNSLYNMVLVHPDVNAAAESWTSKGTKAQLIAAFSSFCPRVKRLISLAPEDGVLEWSLRGHKPVPHWTRGSVALLGGELNRPLTRAQQADYLRCVSPYASVCRARCGTGAGGRDRDRGGLLPAPHQRADPPGSSALPSRWNHISHVFKSALT